MKEKLLTLATVILILLLSGTSYGEETFSKLVATSQDLEAHGERDDVPALTGLPGQPTLASRGLGWQSPLFSLLTGGGPVFRAAGVPATLSQSPVNCSIWPSNCPCSCIQSCHDQYLQCIEPCDPGDIPCLFPCDMANTCCVDQCCGDVCQFGG